MFNNKTMLQFVSVHRLQLLMFVLLMVMSFTTSALAAGPSISGFTPIKGSMGDNVIINGEGFVFPNLSSNKVRFRDKRAVVLVAPSANQLVVTVPDGAIAGQISIENSTGLKTTSEKSFDVIPTSNQIASSGTAPGPGDRIQLETYVTGFIKEEGSDKTEYYAPAKSILWVDLAIDKDGYVLVHFPGCMWFELGCKDLFEPQTNPDTELYKKMVSTNLKYKIQASKLQSSPAFVRGMDYGILVVPFKFHPNDSSLTGEATLGGYAGYRVSWPGIAVSTVLSAGVGVVNLTKQVNGVSTESNAASFTAAGGFIISLMKSGLFQIGILCGTDLAGKGSQYKYEGKTWVSVSFGTNITK